MQIFKLRKCSFLYFFFVCINACFAQDTLVFNGQPNWKHSLDIADNCFIYQEEGDVVFTLEEVKKQLFVPFKNEWRLQKFSNRPLILQWIKFIVRNTSSTDTLNLSINTVHYFTRLFAGNELIAKSGAYETRGFHQRNSTGGYDRGRVPVIVMPQTTITYLLRTEDRQNQLIPPVIFMETKFTGFAAEVESVFEARYLFLILACMTGCFLFISIYAAYNFYLYRQPSFLWYISYTIGAFFSGLHWMDIRLGMFMFSPLLHDIIFSIFLYLIPVLYSFFIGCMLQLNVHFKKGWMFVKLLAFISSIQMILEFIEVRFDWFPFNKNYYGTFLNITPLILLNITLLILTAKSRNPVKWFLFTGIFSLMILWCLPVMNLYSFSIKNMDSELFQVLNFPVVFLLLGLMIEAICFSFALTYQSKLVLVEKNNLQKNYAKDLEEKLEQRSNQLEIQRSLREEQKLKQIAAAFEQKIAETEMTALRAQMNPHFIFNCLNSIKLYTLENDSQTASEYLTIFSQLIRLVLENSRSQKVTLQAELETLRLYIELEAMRFKNKVKYHINISPEIDQQYIDIPPLLIQPYVENAIWHGLMHKKEGGNICINVSLPQEHCLQIEITDDGIGRELAAELKSKSATKQKSFGLKMTSERIDIIHQVHNINADVQILDLKDYITNTTGTKVIIKIPV